LRNIELDQRGRFTAKCQVGTLREAADTSLRIAKDNGISRRSVFRAEAFSKAVDIADEVEPGIRSELLAGKIKPTEKDIRALAKAVPEKRAALIKELRKPPKEKKKQDKPNISNGITLAQARQIGKDMLHSKSRGTKEDMFYELEDAIDCMMFRWTHCLSANADYYAEPECRNKVNQITQAGLDYLRQVMAGEI